MDPKDEDWFPNDLHGEQFHTSGYLEMRPNAVPMNPGGSAAIPARVAVSWHEGLSAAERKAAPLCTGVLDYFPDALLEVARLSKIGNDQHNPGQPMHWAKEKSTDEPDALMRHLMDRGTRDTDGMRHSAKVAWRALAMLQREIESEREANANDGADPCSH